jgi:putative YphP/YqiW family bacilliredoxin
VLKSLADPSAPRRRASVFAGQDVEATKRARCYFEDYPPSSPQVAILSKGKLLFLLQRQQIEGRSAEEVAAALREAYQKVSTAVA